MVNNKTHEATRSDRIVVTTGLESYLPSTLAIAVAFAVTRQSGLHGLFVEDMELLNAASLPFSREILLTSGQPRTLDYQQLICSFNARSRHFRQSLEHQAKQSALSWSYSTARGHKVKMALEQSANAEILIIGQSGKSRSKSDKSKRILLVGDHSDHIWPAFEVILASFPDQPIELIMAISEKPSRDQKSAIPIKKLLTNPRSSLIQITRSKLLDTLAIHLQPLDYLIVSRRDREMTELIIKQTNCSAIIVA